MTARKNVARDISCLHPISTMLIAMEWQDSRTRTKDREKFRKEQEALRKVRSLLNELQDVVRANGDSVTIGRIAHALEDAFREEGEPMIFTDGAMIKQLMLVHDFLGKIENKDLTFDRTEIADAIATIRALYRNLV